MMKLKRAALARVAASGLVLAAFATTEASAEVFDFSFIQGFDVFGFQLDDSNVLGYADGNYSILPALNGYYKRRG